jgi:hypothetical protein
MFVEYFTLINYISFAVISIAWKSFFKLGATQIIRDTLGGGGVAKVSPNITMGGGSKNVK